MGSELTLLLLRLLSAGLLLGFLGLLGWWMWQDVRQTAVLLQTQTQHQATLTVLTAGSSSLVAQTVYTLAPLTTIGRASHSSIVLDSQFASNEHARLLLRHGQWWLEDLHSRNGTLLNGVTVGETAVLLSAGDVIAIGDTQFQFK